MDKDSNKDKLSTDINSVLIDIPDIDISTPTSSNHARRASATFLPPLRSLEEKRLSYRFKSLSYTKLREKSKKFRGSSEIFEQTIREETIQLPVDMQNKFMRSTNLSTAVPGKAPLRRHTIGISEIIPLDRSHRRRWSSKPNIIYTDSWKYLLIQNVYFSIVLLFSYNVAVISLKDGVLFGIVLILSILIALLYKLKNTTLSIVLSGILLVCLGLGVDISIANTLFLASSVALAVYFLQIQSNNISFVIFWSLSLLVYLACRIVRNYIQIFCQNEGSCDQNYTRTIIFFLVSVLCMAYVIQTRVYMYRLPLKQLDDELLGLVTTNLDLQHQIRVENINIQTNITAPLTAATQLLVELLNDPMQKSVLAEITQILDILNSDKLFQPDIFLDTGDKDLTNFLQDVLQNRKTVFLTPTASGRQPTNKASPKHQTTKDILIALESYIDPFFDVISLEVISGGHSLFYLTLTIFQEQNFQSVLGINEKMFKHWLLKMENGYERKNPYHNSTHAADVVHSLYYFITRDKLKCLLAPEEVFACVVAAIGHDYMHPGFTNAFLVATKNPLALRYNDQCVLENFHAASVKETFLQSEFNLLECLTPPQQETVRSLITSMILATDIGSHFELLGKFKTKLSSNSFNYENINDKKLILNMAIKCADVNNLTKPLSVSRMWTQLIMDEFFIQGDHERERGLPISIFMDRKSADIPKCQLGFIEYIVQPIFESWKMFYNGEIDEHSKNIENNKIFWKAASDNHILVDRIEMPKVVISTLKFERSFNVSKAKDTSGSSIDIKPELSLSPVEKRSTSFFRKLTMTKKDKPDIDKPTVSGSDTQYIKESNFTSDDTSKHSDNSVDVVPKRPSFFKRFTFNSKKNSVDNQKIPSPIAGSDNMTEGGGETDLVRRKTSIGIIVSDETDLVRRKTSIGIIVRRNTKLEDDNGLNSLTEPIINVTNSLEGVNIAHPKKI